MRLLPVPPSVSTAPKVVQVREDVLYDHQAVAQANVLVRPQAVRPAATINSSETMSNSGNTLSGAAPRTPSRLDGSREVEGKRMQEMLAQVAREQEKGGVTRTYVDGYLHGWKYGFMVF